MQAGGRTDGRTGHSQVAVCLDLPRQVAGEALKHPRVVWQEAVDLQAASHQHSVPGDLHRTDGNRIFVPHDVWLRRACTQERGQKGLLDYFFSPSATDTNFLVLPSFSVEQKPGGERALTSGLAGDVHHFLHLGADVSGRLFDKHGILCSKVQKQAI